MGAGILHDMRIEHQIGRGQAAKRDRRKHDGDVPFETPRLAEAKMTA